MSPGLFNQQEHLSALVGPYSGVYAPALRVESACASGSSALRVAMMAINAGYYDSALVLGVEKMTDLIDIGDVTTTFCFLCVFIPFYFLFQKHKFLPWKKLLYLQHVLR